MHTQCPATAISSRRRTRPARDQGSGAGPSVSAQLTAERKPRADRQVGRTRVCSQAFSSTEPHSSEPLSRLVVLSPVPFVPTYLLHFFFPLIILQPPPPFLLSLLHKNTDKCCKFTPTKLIWKERLLSPNSKVCS